MQHGGALYLDALLLARLCRTAQTLRLCHRYQLLVAAVFLAAS
jgi:hypothetical protein